MGSRLHFHDDAIDTHVNGTFVLLMNFMHSWFPYDVGIMNVHLVDQLKFEWAKICICETACTLCVYQLDLTYDL